MSILFNNFSVSSSKRSLKCHDFVEFARLQITRRTDVLGFHNRCVIFVWPQCRLTRLFKMTLSSSVWWLLEPLMISIVISSPPPVLSSDGSWESQSSFGQAVAAAARRDDQEALAAGPPQDEVMARAHAQAPQDVRAALMVLGFTQDQINGCLRVLGQDADFMVAIQHLISRLSQAELPPAVRRQATNPTTQMEQQQQQPDQEETTKSWFDQLSKHIHSNGGYVHPRLHFCQPQRQLILLPEDSDRRTGRNSDDFLTPSKKLFHISQRSLITYNVATQICPWLLEEEEALNSSAHQYHFPYEDLAIAVALATCLDNEEKSEKEDSDSLENNDEDEKQIDPSQQQQQQQHQLECRRLVKLYLQSLPESVSTSASSSTSSYYDTVPRRWSCETINELLGGSSVVERIQASKVHVKQDYDMLKEQFQSWKKKNTKVQNNSKMKKVAMAEDVIVFPSFERFDDMLVAVSSRAFQLSLGGGGTSSRLTTPTTNIAMIPLLDLCDHCRGNRQTNEKKNVSYKLVSKPASSGAPRSSDSIVAEAAAIAPSSSSMLLEVTSTETLSTGQPLRLTYGAQGNAQLLVNYGFCIRDNVEPDGSSNDILELKLPRGRNKTTTATMSKKRKITNDSAAPMDQDQQETTVAVSLRMGPKSYTYGNFVKALESFFPHQDDDDDDGMMIACNSSMHKRSEVANSPSTNDQDEMDDFLNSCENEDEEQDEYGGDEDDDGDFDDLMYGVVATSSVSKEEGGEMDEERNYISKVEIQALGDFRQELVATIERYSLRGVSLQKALNVDKSSTDQDWRRYFAAILCSSEIRTLCFFIIAIDKLLAKLDFGKEEGKKLDASPRDSFDPEHLNIVEKQTDELVTSYMMIRHS